jgi:hypothetical protein
MAGISEPTHAELARLVGAARAAGGVSRGSNLRLTIAVAAFLATLSIFPHAMRGRAFLPSPIVGAVSPEPSLGRPPEESPAMRAAGLAVVVSVGVVSGVANAGDAVQWRVEDGGNGHWYIVDNQGRLWADAKNHAEAIGGHLATITSEDERQVILPLLLDGVPADAWLGASRPGPVQLPGWVTSEPFDFAVWTAGHPSSESQRCCLEINCRPETGEFGRWSIEYPFAGGGGQSSVIEFDADCNADGIVDYGQILAGELSDANGNNIPDCCENGVPCDPCAAVDLDASGAVNGVDLAIILNTWGTDGGKYPQADVDGDGVVGGTDLALILGAWGECP